MSLEDELATMEDGYQTEAEQIDEETEIQDVEDDLDEILGPDAMESDQEVAYDSFITKNEADYDGYDPSRIEVEEQETFDSNVLHSEGYHLEDAKDLEEEVIEMEIEDGDIVAYLMDEDDNEIGFVLIDENGDEQEYYYVDSDEYVEEGDEEGRTVVIRESDEEEFELGITREGIAEATEDANVVYKEGAEVFAELKETIDDISEGMSFLKKK